MSFGDWYEGVKNYIWASPSEQKKGNLQSEESDHMPRISRINRLSTILNHSVYQKQIQQQICMFYSSLLDQYPQAKATKQIPAFLYEPNIYTPLLSFLITIKIQTSSIYCELDLVVMFPEQLSTKMPIFYVRNPDFNAYKPREKLLVGEKRQNMPYQAVFGGLRIILPTISQERWKWTPDQYYKQENIVNMVRYIHKRVLLDNFPFSKRKQPINFSIFEKSRQIKEFMQEKVLKCNQFAGIEQNRLLETIQSSQALKKAISGEISSLKEKSDEIKQFIKNSQHFNTKQFYPEPSDPKSAQILECSSSLHALRDVERMLENKFFNGEFNLSDFKTYISKINQKQFSEMSSLSRLCEWGCRE